MDQELIVGQLEKATLKNRYIIGRHLDSGSNGHVYKITDIENPKIPLVLKISDECLPFSEEINTMRKISAAFKDTSIPNVVAYGILHQELEGVSSMNAYLIMPRYGHNLDTWFEKMKFKISVETILDLAQRLLTIIEGIHSAGYAYNDLKLDNIMVGYGQRMQKVKQHEEKSSFSGVSLHLVDFGYSSKFMKKKAHIKCEELKSFKGNMMFSSLNQL